MRVYLLGDYEEHGTINLVGTASKGKVPALFEQHALARGWPATDKEREALRRMLETDDLCEGADLLCGWGGTKLYVIDLQ